MNPPQSPSQPAVVTQATPGGQSSLGGSAAIKARFDAFRAQESAPEGNAPETPTAPQKETTQKPDAAPPEKKSDAILPPEKEVPKAPEKKPEPQKPQSTEPPKKGSDNLTKEERAELVAFKEKAARVDELEQKVKDHEATSKERDELKTLTKQLEDKAKVYEAKATAFDVTSTPHFQDTISKPMQALVEGMESICKSNNLAPEEVFSAIQNPDETKGNTVLSEFVGTMDSFTSRKFERIVNDMRELSRKGQALIDKAPEAWTAIQEEQKKRESEAKTKAQETYTAANQAVMREMKERFPFLKDDKIGEEVLKEAQGVNWDDLSPDKKAYFAQAGYVMLHINSQMKTLREENESLKAAMKRDQPFGPDGGNKETANGQETNKERDDDAFMKMTSGQRFAATFGLGQR